jgi:hypothetical protein
MLRLGYFTSRRTGDSLWEGDVVVFLRPHGPVPQKLVQQVENYVRGGGKVLIVDSLRPDSATYQLLRPFGLSIDLEEPVHGALQTKAQQPSIPVSDAAKVVGGEPFAWIDGQPVGASQTLGSGAVFVFGCATRFCDANLAGAATSCPTNRCAKGLKSSLHWYDGW